MNEAANLGVTAAAIGGTVNTMIGGEIIGKYKDEKEGERYDITARLIKTEREQPDDIDDLRVRSSTGELVKLREVTNPGHRDRTHGDHAYEPSARRSDFRQH